MPVSHAPVPSRAPDAAAGRERVPGLLEVLAQVADPRQRRGRRFTLAFTLAVAVVCVLAGARSFREIGDQAADLPQDMLAALGGVPVPAAPQDPGAEREADPDPAAGPGRRRARRASSAAGCARLAAAGKAGAGRRSTSRSTASGCAASATGRSSCSPRSSTTTA